MTRALLATATVVLLATATPATATGDVTVAPADAASLLALPIDMIAELAAADGALPTNPDAGPAELAYGLFQRGAWAEARATAEPLAEAGDAAMAALLARIHGEGLGTPADAELAVAWLERAAGAGDATARHDLAVMRMTGRGVARDEALGLDMLRELAADGHPTATFDLAQALLSGERTEAEVLEGEGHLRAAAASGLPQASYALARFIEASVPADDLIERQRALGLLVDAARSGLVDAQMELGDWLMSGRTGRVDRKAGRAWIERAARAGFPLALARLRRLDAADAARSSALPGVTWDARYDASVTAADPSNRTE